MKRSFVYMAVMALALLGVVGCDKSENDEPAEPSQSGRILTMNAVYEKVYPCFDWGCSIEAVKEYMAAQDGWFLDESGDVKIATASWTCTYLAYWNKKLECRIMYTFNIDPNPGGLEEVGVEYYTTKDSNIKAFLKDMQEMCGGSKEESGQFYMTDTEVNGKPCNVIYGAVSLSMVATFSLDLSYYWNGMMY